MSGENKRVSTQLKQVRISMGNLVSMPSTLKIGSPPRSLRASCISALRKAKVTLSGEQVHPGRFALKDIALQDKELVAILRVRPDDEKQLVQGVEAAGLKIAHHEPLLKLRVGPIPPGTTQADLDRRLVELKGAWTNGCPIEKGIVHLDINGASRNLEIDVRRARFGELKLWTSWQPEDVVNGRAFHFRQRVMPKVKFCKRCCAQDHYHSKNTPCSKPPQCCWCGKKGHCHNDKKCTNADRVNCMVCGSPEHGSPQCPQIQETTVELDDRGYPVSRSDRQKPSQVRAPVSQRVSSADTSSETQRMIAIRSDMNALHEQAESKIASLMSEVQALKTSQQAHSAMLAAIPEMQAQLAGIPTLRAEFSAQLAAHTAAIMARFDAAFPAQRDATIIAASVSTGTSSADSLHLPPSPSHASITATVQPTGAAQPHAPMPVLHAHAPTATATAAPSLPSLQKPEKPNEKKLKPSESDADGPSTTPKAMSTEDDGAKSQRSSLKRKSEASPETASKPALAGRHCLCQRPIPSQNACQICR